MSDTDSQADIREALKEGEDEYRKRERSFMMYRIRKSPLSMIGIAIVMIFVLIALAAPLIATPNQPDPFRMPKTFSRLPLPPSKEHPFGTTGPVTYGDVFYGVIWGTRYSLMLAFSITAICFSVGILVGVIAGYYGGIIDDILMRIVDLFYSLPWLVVMLVILIAIGKRGFWTMVIAYSILAWPGYSRVVRGEVLRVKNELYVEAAKAMGLTDLQIILRHVLPNSIRGVGDHHQRGQELAAPGELVDRRIPGDLHLLLRPGMAASGRRLQRHPRSQVTARRLSRYRFFFSLPYSSRLCRILINSVLSH